jgi:hypothetical protein
MSAQSEAYQKMMNDRFGGNEQLYQDAMPSESEGESGQEEDTGSPSEEDNSPGLVSGILGSISGVIGGVLKGIDDYYMNVDRQKAIEMSDENGNITPESIQEYEEPQTYYYNQGQTGDYENPDTNPTYQAIGDPSYNVDSPMYGPQSWGYGTRNDLNEWGNTAAQDLSKLGTDIVDSITADSWQDFQDHDSTAADDAWKAYTDFSRPAGMIAVTPGLPGPVRIAAGAFYAPKMLADIRGMYEQGSSGNPEEGTEGSALGGVGNVAKGLFLDPIAGVAHDITNIGGLVHDIQQHPAALWDRVFMPATMAEGAYKGGRKIYKDGKAVNDFINSDDSGVRFTPEAMGESGGYRPIESDSSSYGRTVDEALGDKEPAQGAYEPEPEPQPREVNTGSEYDAEINQAAAEYGVDPVLAHAVAQAESQHGKSTSNVFGVDGVSDPHQSIRIGVKSLKRCIDDNGGDVRKGLREYNGSDAGGTPDYDDRVLNIANEYGGLGSAGGGAGGDAYSIGAGAWMGAEMPNGANGCVDAVVRIGSYYDPFLKDEADKGVASVPKLVEDARAAGKQVIDFDPNALEKGDTIVYGDNEHVVAYDGNGGYVGNSTSLGRVVHGGDYTQMDGLTPTKIIKTSDHSGGAAGMAPEMGGNFRSEDPMERAVEENDGPVKDIHGETIGMDEDARSGEQDEGQTTGVKEEPQEEPAETPEQAAEREKKYKERYSALDQQIEVLEEMRQQEIDDEVERMQRNPGGKGVDQGLIEDAEGNTTRWAQSNNPQWYQDAYAKLGRAPKKSEFPGIAEENLLKEQEFYERDRILGKLKDLREQIKKDPDADYEKLLNGEQELQKPEVKTEEHPKEPEPVNAEKKGEATKTLDIGPDYHTESGRPLNEASPDEYVVKNDGDKNFGVITPEISKAVYDKTGEILPPGRIRLKVGNDAEGLIHAKIRHTAEALKAGYSSVEELISDIASNFDIISKKDPPPNRPDLQPTYNLIKLGDKSKNINNGITPTYLTLESDGHGTYNVVTSILKGDKSLKRQLKNEHLIYSRPGVDTAFWSNPESVSRPRGENVGAAKDVRPASDKSSASTSTIPQAEANGAPSGKNNLVQNDAVPARTNQAGLGVLEPGEPVPDVNGNMPVSMLPKAKSNGAYMGEVTRKGIFDRVRELFGPVRTGRVEDRRALGQYDRGSDVARVGEWGNFDTMMHEIGHKIDQYLGLSKRAGKKYHAEFASVLSKKYGGDIPYRPDQYTSEGIAEFMKTYVTKGDEAAKKAFPTYYKDWTEAVRGDKDLSARVAEMHDAMQKYNNLPGGAKIAGTIQKEKPTTIKEAWQSFKDQFIENWVDDKWGIRKAEKEIEKIIGRELTKSESAYIYARMAIDRGTNAAAQLLTDKDAAAVTKAINKLYGGVCDKVVTLPQIIDDLQQLDKAGKTWLKAQGLKDAQEALSSYLIANSFLDAYNIKEVKPYERAQQALADAQAELDAAREHLGRVRGEAPVKAARERYEAAKQAVQDATAAVEKARNAHYKMPLSAREYQRFVDSAPKELKDAAQKVYDLNHNVLKIMEYGGLISKKLRETLEKEHPHYASLARVFEDDANEGAGMGFGSSSSFVNVSNNLKKLTNAGSVRDVRDPVQSMTQNIVDVLTRVERNKVGQKFTDMAKMYGTGGIVERVKGTPKTNDSTFYVWRNGEKQVYQTTPEIYRAFQSLKPQGMDSFIKLMLAMPAKFMRAGAVIYNPAFLAKNLLRDQLTAYLNSKYGYKPYYDMAKGIFHMLKQDEIYHEFKASGVNMSSILYDSQTIVPDLMKAWQHRGLRDKIFRAINPATSLPALSKFIEQSTRIGLYGRARSKGASILDATMEAREGTLDFGRAGVKGREWNRSIPFFNAVIQDPILFMEKFTENPARYMKRCAPMIMGSLAVYALIQSNDQTAKEYDEMMPYEKNMFWNIPVPKSVSKTGWVRYPKPFGPGFLFASFPERLADFAKGHDKTGKGLKEWAKGFLEQFVPVSMPPIFQASYEWMSNYSTFRDRSVVPQREQKLPNAMQYDSNTSEVAKAIGGALDLSPRKIDNLGQNLFAGAWSSANNAIDALAGKKRNNNPFSTLTVDPYRAPQSIQDFYDAMDKSEKQYNGEKLKGKPSGTATANHKMLTKANKAMSDLNKQERAAIAAGDDDKVDIINRKQLKLAQSALAQLKK